MLSQQQLKSKNIINSNQKSQNIFNKSKHAKKRLGKKGLYPNFPKWWYKIYIKQKRQTMNMLSKTKHAVTIL
jgi:hypothetical protein